MENLGRLRRDGRRGEWTRGTKDGSSRCVRRSRLDRASDACCSSGIGEGGGAGPGVAGLPGDGRRCQTRRRTRRGRRRRRRRSSSRRSARTSPTPPSGPASLATNDKGGGRGRARHAREPHRPGRSRSGRWATAPRSARARPRSSPRKDLLVRLQAPRFFVAEGRGRPVGQRPQLPQDREERAASSLELDGGTPGSRWATLDAARSTIAAGGETARRLARQGRPRRARRSSA